MKRQTLVTVLDTLSTLGILVILFFVVTTYIQTIDILREVKRNQATNQKASKERDDTNRDLLICIATTKQADRTVESLMKGCAVSPNNPNPKSNSAPVPTVQTNPTPKQTPTTSTPPEEPRKNPVRRVGERLTELSDVLESVIKGVLGDDTK